MGQLNNEENVKVALSQLLDEYSREKPVLANEGRTCKRRRMVLQNDQSWNCNFRALRFNDYCQKLGNSD